MKGKAGARVPGSENKPIASPAELRAAVYGFRRSRIILTAFELGTFQRNERPVADR